MKAEALLFKQVHVKEEIGEKLPSLERVGVKRSRSRSSSIVSDTTNPEDEEAFKKYTPDLLFHTVHRIRCSVFNSLYCAGPEKRHEKLNWLGTQEDEKSRRLKT